MEVGEEEEYIYTYRYTVTTRTTPALRWAVTRAISMFHNCEGQSHKTVSTSHNFRKERTAQAVSNRGPSAYQPTALPLGQTGSLSSPPLAPVFLFTSDLGEPKGEVTLHAEDNASLH